MSKISSIAAFIFAMVILSSSVGCGMVVINYDKFGGGGSGTDTLNSATSDNADTSSKYEAVENDFSEKIAHILESKFPERYTTNIRKNTRKGKIFIDFMRNTRTATSVAPYSLRARPGAKVSCPIAWSELDKIAPNDIDLHEVLRRLKKPDPWKNFDKISQSLN